MPNNITADDIKGAKAVAGYFASNKTEPVINHQKDIIQLFNEARVDARSLSDFMYKPAGQMVSRRLSNSVHTFEYFYNKIGSIDRIVQNAINNTAVPGGIIADTFVTVTANGAEKVARTQRAKNNEVLSVYDFGAVGDGVANDTAAFEKAHASGEAVLVPADRFWLDHLVPEVDYYHSNFYTNGLVEWTNDNRRVFFRHNVFGNMTTRISNSQTVGREELQIYANGDPWGEDSRGSGIHLYGNKDLKHSGAIALMTGQDDSGDARMIITGGTSDPTQRAYRGTDNNTHVTIGNGIWRFTDAGKDIGLLNLRTPINSPAIRISNVSDDDPNVADIGISDGRDFTIKQYVETTVQEPTVSQYVFQLNRNGGARFYDARNSSDNTKYALFRPDFSNGSTPKLEIRCDKTLSDGAGINLYGGNDNSISLFTGGKTSVEINEDSGIRLYQSEHINDSPKSTHKYSLLKPSLGDSESGALEIRANKTLGDGSGINMYATIEGNILFFTGGSTSLRLEAIGNKALTAGTDAAQSLGTASMRWDDLFLLNAPTVSSDRRIKTEIKPIDALVLKAWESVEWVQYRLKDSVDKKGKKARIHTGLIAQNIEKAFADQGLDAYDYGVLCKGVWDDELDHEGKVVIKAGELLSVRYEQAQAIESAYIRSKLQLVRTAN